MHREVGAYETLGHEGIPRLVESNAQMFDDPSFQLFLVTEYVEGANLSTIVSEHGPLSAPDALNLTSRLLEVIAYCHSQECVHRDIKPDNIVLAGRSPSKPVLVDFGLSFNAWQPSPLDTENRQELGNRFLRLPELGIDGANKRDPRSDLSSVCGVLLYALTGSMPVSLLDEHSQLPHQRPHILSKLAQLPINVTSLLQLLDRGFQLNINSRWHRAEQLYEAVQQLRNTTVDVNKPKSSEELLRELTKRATTASMQQAIAHRQTLELALRNAQAEFGEVVRQLQHLLTTSQGGYGIDLASLSGQNTLGAIRLDGRGRASFLFRVQVVGSQLTTTCTVDGASSAELLRTDAVSPQFDGAYRESLRLLVLNRIGGLLADG